MAVSAGPLTPQSKPAIRCGSATSGGTPESHGKDEGIRAEDLSATVLAELLSDSLEPDHSPCSCDILHGCGQQQRNETEDFIARGTNDSTLTQPQTNWSPAGALVSLLGRQPAARVADWLEVSLRAWTESKKRMGRRRWRAARAGGTGWDLGEPAEAPAVAVAAADAASEPRLVDTG